MRTPVDAGRIKSFLTALGAQCRGPGRVYLTGGATALLYGWRGMTQDVDLKLDPEPVGAFEAIATLKEELGINVELASPDLFLPPLPGWRDRSVFLDRFGAIDVYHYDLYSQALAKISRGHDRDLDDVRAMFARKLFECSKLVSLFSAIEGDFVRHPELDAAGLRKRLDEFLKLLSKARA